MKNVLNMPEKAKKSVMAVALAVAAIGVADCVKRDVNAYNGQQKERRLESTVRQLEVSNLDARTQGDVLGWTAGSLQAGAYTDEANSLHGQVETDIVDSGFIFLGSILVGGAGLIVGRSAPRRPAL